jgi:hypothetical protein
MGPVSHRALIAFAVALAGCGGSQHAASAPSVSLSVVPSTTSNRGRPLQAVVRAVTLKQFVEEPYTSIARLVIAPDDSVLASFVVFPGVAQTIRFAPPAKGGVAVYFLFTGATGTSWKQLFDNVPSTIHLELGDNQIKPPSSSPASGDKQKSRS